MAKPKSGSSKKRGRGYLGNPENKLSVNGKSNEKPKKEKKSARGPAAFISDPNSHLDSRDEQEEYQRMLDAEEMVGSGQEEEEEEEEEEEKEKGEEDPSHQRQKKKFKVKGDKASTSDQMRFLLKINEKEISKSRPELEKIKKLETKAAREEESRRLKEKKLNKSKSKSSLAKDSGSGSEASTDMEGLSDSDLDSQDQDAQIEDSFDSEDFQDSDLDALESLQDSEAEVEEEEEKFEKILTKKNGKKESERKDYQREEDYLLKMKKVNKRKHIEEENEREINKKRKLPVRDVNGGWREEDLIEDEDEEEVESEGGEQDEEMEGVEDQARGENEDVLEKTKLSRKDKGKAKEPVPSSSRVTHIPISAQDLEDSEDSDSDEDDEGKKMNQEPTSTILTSRRFGLAAPFEIISLKKKSLRILGAREQIARLATDIVGDPEVGLGMLRRLSVFAGEKIDKPIVQEEDKLKSDEKKPLKSKGKNKGDQDDGPESLPVDEPIRAAALLSLLAVFVDVLPGYRIRPLTDQEQNEKVNQELMRRREWEQGLVKIYQEFLELCEGILRDRNQISPVALHCLCTLLTRAPHFNFRTNIIKCIVSKLSKKSWDSDSEKCSNSLIEVLRSDRLGDVSLEIVRLLHRMIKERGYKINSRVLDILLHLRLRDELGEKRASTNQAEGGRFGKGRKREDGGGFGEGKDKAKPKDVRKGMGKHLSKKMVKKMREVKEIEKEMKEAEAEIDVEEREKNQTETLKLLFVLYFSILKSPSVPGTLLGSALEGLARFAHRVNVDFFRDLLSVLRVHINNARASMTSPDVAREGSNSKSTDQTQTQDLTSQVLDQSNPTQAERGTREALLCLVTAFELLSGQGEALNIDLSDFVSHLYSILLPLSLNPNIEDIPITSSSSSSTTTNKLIKGGAIAHLSTLADLLFRALDLCLLRPKASTIPSERSASFIKKLLTCSLHWPPKTTLRSLGMIKTLLGRDSKLEALLDTEDRAKDGKFDHTSDDVESSRPLASGEVAWELEVLGTNCNEDVREAAMQILAWNR